MTVVRDRGAPGRPAVPAPRADRVRRAAELLGVVALLALLAVAAFGAQLRPGGFYNDDWAYLTNAVFPADDSFAGAVRELSWIWFRPLMMVYWPFTFRVLGTDPTVHEAWTLLMGVGLGTTVFLLLRTLGVVTVHAAAIAALVLLAPVSDSTRLWPAMSANVLAVALYAGGVVVALHGLRRTRPAAFWSIHGGALALFLASVLLYEIAASLILVTGALYVLRAGRRGLAPWALDVVVTSAVLVLVTSHTFYRPMPFGDELRQAWVVARQVPWVVGELLWAPGDPGAVARVAAVLAVAGVLLGGAWAVRRPGADPAWAAAVRAWLRLAAGAAVATGVAYLMLVPSGLLEPRGLGESNRGNVAAAVALQVVVYAAVVVAALLLTRRLAAWPRASAALAVAAAAVMGAGALHQARADQRVWEAAAREQQRIVDVVAGGSPAPPPGTTFLSFGAPLAAGPGIPVFQAVWDLSGALRLRFGGRALSAYPVPFDGRVECGAGGLVLHSANSSFRRQAARYGAVRFVDVPRARVLEVPDRARCRALARQLLR